VSGRLSEPVAPGTVQLPADGQPIVLLADAQSHGGYPRIGHVAAADLPRLAQLRPGDALHFVPCTPAQALRLRREQAGRLARIALAVAGRQLD
jgi:antagonist of KipI